MTELRTAGSRYARELTDLLQTLKGRADCSYEALARRAGVSGSTLHRYCSGAGVPNDFDPLARFGKACGADQHELLELHRLWVLVDAGRRRGTVRAEPARGARPAEQSASPTARATVAATVTPAETPTVSGEPEVTKTPAPSPGSEAEPPRPPHRPRLPHLLRLRRLPRPRRWPLVLVALLAVGATVMGAALLTDDRPAGADDAAGRPLLTDKCRFVAMGHQDSCVRELQLRLKQVGLDLEVDGAFGPITQMRVVVFQVLAGLEANGSVDDRTKRALYAGHVKAHPWSPARVDRRVREVFTEDPDRASGIAECASNLDPLYSLGNTNGTRNWGVFQLYDGTLRQLGGTPRKALDPEWNIRAAHRLWARTHDFRAWPSCDKAYEAGAATASQKQP
ncbi:helix-turn-helix domain-containing protein [Streptomyces sp. HGB0020]|uniref:helix-turn-helix domain-containing protein n=1 Tax=Streptomyces sp. HGB0020 TaxID=1078086 RepID=UPI00034E85D6|nr:helix-turn-helix domain-containing protein [Streptomyces sp. HGB0020]EPD58803.1 hypothetical protein HMPREF1211_05742 [Streptomyces sp. HGB0020]